jgi:phosphoglycolate phosphatase
MPVASFRYRGGQDAASSRYRAILFDLDGTLVDSFGALHASLSTTMKALGLIPWDLETTKQHVGLGVEYLVESAVGKQKVTEALPIFRKNYGETCLGRTRLLPSVSSTLPVLQASGYRLAVATNKPLVFARNILEQLGVQTYFELVLGPEKVAHPKPHPDMIHAILGDLQIAKRNALYVGDMPLDVETASRAGVDCILLATGPYPYARLAAVASVPVLRTFGEIPDCLQQGK